MTETAPKPSAIDTALARFDRSLYLRQPAFWSRAIIWSILGFTVLCILWMIFAQIEEVVVATGKLEPTGAVRDIQAPVAGVIERSYVEEGQFVHKGEHLLRLDQTVTSAQIASQQTVRESLRREIAFYAQQMADTTEVAAPDPKEGALPPEMLTLARDRANLVAENRLYRAEFQNSAEGIDLPPDQMALFQNAEQDRAARLREWDLAIDQASSQLEGSKSQLVQTERLVDNNKKVLAAYTSLAAKSVVSELDRLAREGDLIRTENELQKLRTGVAGLELEIRKDHEQRDGVDTTYKKDALAGIEKNQQRIAEIDSRLSKAILDDKQRLAQIEGQLTQLDASLGYQELLAPVDGVVLDVRGRQPGSVIAASDLLLRIVPNEELIAKVSLPNKDIGFVRKGMQARVRIDSFPFREFGDVGGDVTFIGSDALPPTQTTPYYSFPAKVQLSKQHLVIRGQKVKLQSGMSVTVNMQVRKRSIMSVAIDMLLRPSEKLRELR